MDLDSIHNKKFKILKRTQEVEERGKYRKLISRSKFQLIYMEFFSYS